MKRRWVLCVTFFICALCLLCVSFRIYCVNASSLRIPVDFFEAGQIVELDGCFLGQSVEKTKGYTIEVVGTRTMSRDEYLERYGQAGLAYEEEPNELWDGGPESKDVLVVEMDITNRDNSDGYIAMLNWRIVPGSLDDAYMPNLNLLATSEEVLYSSEKRGYAQVGMGVTHRLAVPFCKQEERGFFTPANEAFYAKIHEGDYSLTLSNYPIRKIVNFTIA